MTRQAMLARTTILAAAPACIEKRRMMGQNTDHVEALHVHACTLPTLNALAIAQLESYARTMARTPPTARTIQNLLHWLTLEEPTACKA